MVKIRDELVSSFGVINHHFDVLNAAIAEHPAHSSMEMKRKLEAAKDWVGRVCEDVKKQSADTLLPSVLEPIRGIVRDITGLTTCYYIDDPEASHVAIHHALGRVRNLSLGEVDYVLPDILLRGGKTPPDKKG